MTTRSKLLVVMCFVVCWLLWLGTNVGRATEPLPSAHAHNDYWHERPLLDALDRGFTSVEADVFLVNGQLQVGHEVTELKPDRTLESLYLEPLSRRVRKNGGHVYPNGQRFFLLVDIKSDADATYQQLHDVLTKHADMLTRVDSGKTERGAVTVVLSGNRPVEAVSNASIRYVGLDGRLGDLSSEAPADLMPMISDSWSTHFTWRGKGPIPPTERTKLREIVRKAHAAGRVVRFWATPENEAVWRELRLAGVDLIGSDQLGRLARFLSTAAAASRSSVRRVE